MGDAESGMALRGWKRRQEGKTLYITARKVPVSPSFREGAAALSWAGSCLIGCWWGRDGLGEALAAGCANPAWGRRAVNKAAHRAKKMAPARTLRACPEGAGYKKDNKCAGHVPKVNMRWPPKGREP